MKLKRYRAETQRRSRRGFRASVYAEKCASCHGVALEGRLTGSQRDADGYLPAPPHDETGHTWHHPDLVPLLMTKYGIERLLENHTATTCLLMKTSSPMKRF